MKLANALVTLLGALLISGAPVAADAKESTSTVTRLGVTGSDSSLELSWDKPLTAAEEDEAQKSLQGALGEEAPPSLGEEAPRTMMVPPDHGGPQYPVVKCTQGNRTFTDRNGRFDVRYNCPHNNINWGYRVSPKLVAISVGPMTETGVVWYRGLNRIGQNSPHTVPVNYFLHGTQRGVADADVLHWHDTLTFRVAVGGRTGTAVLNVGGSFLISRH